MANNDSKTPTQAAPQTAGKSITVFTTVVTVTGSNGALTTKSKVTSSTIAPTTSTTGSTSAGATAPSIADTGQHTNSAAASTPAAASQTSTPSSGAGTPVGAGGNQTSSPTANPSNGNVTTGALAGAVVASIVGAAIITFLLAWLFFRKRNQRNQRTHRSGSHRSNDHRSPGRHEYAAVGAAGMKEKSSSSSGDSGYSWQAYLPQSADDQTIKSNVKTLFDQIELHVDNYYTKANIRLDSGTREALSQFNDDKLPDSIEALMANPQTTLPTIKYCIARTLVARMSPAHERSSLLPAYLAAEPTRLSSSMPPAEQTAAQQAYSQLRLLNAYLHPRPDQDRDYQQQRESVANEISNDLSDTFASWQGAQENLAGLKQHERSLVTRAADVATLIMSQPSVYEFWWSSSSQAFIIFPGFLKTTDERGRTLDQPQTLIQPAPAR